MAADLESDMATCADAGAGAGSGMATGTDAGAGVGVEAGQVMATSADAGAGADADADAGAGWDVKTAALADLLGGAGGGRVPKVHMLGVNGISMSGLAEILLDGGCRVTGSDLTSSDRTERLKGRGAKIYAGNSAANVDADDPPDLLVYTAAAGPDNPERVRAAELGVASADRAALLGLIMAGYDTSIGVSGTNGKTTTSFMLASILLEDGRDPTINVGGEYAPIGGNTRIGGRGMFLAEACEYTDSFLKLRPTIAVITNIAYDHSDYFADIAQLRGSFAAFAGQAGRAAVANADDENVALVREKFNCNNRRWVSFSLEESRGADYYASDIAYDDKFCGSFTLMSAAGRGRVCGIRLRVPGAHNVYNALAAAAAALTAGCSPTAVAAGLEAFCGVKKRFEYKGSLNGFDIYDDYAHHPTEVRPALETARRRARGGKVICVFQPHTYTRTRTFLAEFSEVFTAADRVLLADIFPAREKDPGDINSAILAEAINRAGGCAYYVAGGFEPIAQEVLRTAAAGDLVLTMGAGLASTVADILLG